MKKLILLFIFLLFTINSYAGNCVSQGTGNWSNTATWGTTCNGATPAIPVANDDVEIATGHIVTWDVASGARIPATSGSLAALHATGTSTGQVTVNLSDAACHGTNTCSLNVTGDITAGYKPAAVGFILITGAAASDHILAINTANITAGGNSSSTAIMITSTGGVTITAANIYGSSSTAARGVYAGSTGVVIMTVSGEIKGGASGNGFYADSSGTTTVNGNVVGGSGVSVFGIFIDGLRTATINGNTTGGTSAGADGTRAAGAGAITITGNIINVATAAGASGRITYSPGAATNYITYGATNYYYDIPIAGNVTEDDTVAGVTGTYHEAAIAEVQSGITFGANSSLTGTYPGGGSWSY